MPAFKDLTGKRFGRLTIVDLKSKGIGSGKKTFWNCKCDCGTECIKESYAITKGYTVSCGCYRKDVFRNRRKFIKIL